MKFSIPYLDRILRLEVPDDNLLSVAEPNVYGVNAPPEEILDHALEFPLAADGGQGTCLPDFLSGAERVLIIINDATRPTPTEAMLDLLVPILGEQGIGPDSITIIVATGAHREPTEEEYHQLLGRHYDSLRKRSLAHKSRNDLDMVSLGTTRNGTPIAFNRLVFETDRVVITGSVEPHYFAGFTGGRKAFLPGIAAYRTIEANHKLALNKNARALSLEGNPVHEDMLDALTYIEAPIFSLMTVLDGEQRIAAATAGDIFGSFFAAVDIARLIFCVSVPEQADVVVSVAKFPMDIDLYQSQKAINNGALVLKDGGTLILVSSCRDGIGDAAYANLLAAADSPQEALRNIDREYKLGYHKAAKMAEVSAMATVVAKTELPAESLCRMFIEPVESLQVALDQALARARASGSSVPKVVILPDGCITVPSIEP